jgi:hypothetical protein
MSPVEGIMVAKLDDWASSSGSGGEGTSQVLGSYEKELKNNVINLDPVKDLPKKSQLLESSKAPLENYWPNRFCLGDKKIDDRNHRLTLPPASICAVEDPDIFHVEEKMRGMSKKDFIKAIREGSLN